MHMDTINPLLVLQKTIRKTMKNNEIASFKKHSCFENRIPKINNVFPKTAVTFLEAGTLNAPRNHQENIKSVPRELKTHT